MILRSDVALDAIEAVARAVPQMHLGAGTVTRPSDVPRVIDAGASVYLFGVTGGAPGSTVTAVGDRVLQQAGHHPVQRIRIATYPDRRIRCIRNRLQRYRNRCCNRC